MHSRVTDFGSSYGHVIKCIRKLNSFAFCRDCQIDGGAPTYPKLYLISVKIKKV